MKEWKYLLSPAFKCRQALAAQFVRGCRSVVEIGSYKVPITPFLIGPHDRVICVDPLIEPVGGAPFFDGRRKIASSLHHVQVPFQEYENYPESEFGLIALGFGILQNLHPAFLEIAKRAQRVVLEGWQDWPPFSDMLPLIYGEFGWPKLDVLLDLSNNDLGDISGGWPPRLNRRMLYWERQ